MRARMYWDPAEEELLRCQEPWDKTRVSAREASAELDLLPAVLPRGQL